MLPTTRLAIPAIAALALCSCNVNISEPSGPLQHATKTIALDKSEMVRVGLKMGAGELKIRGGSANLMDADFSYIDPAKKPDIRYNATGFRSHLDIEEPSGGHRFGNKDHGYEWDLKLNNDVPLSLDLEFGAGQANLELGALNLQNVNVRMGVGQLDLDLQGTPKKDYQVEIHGGVGQATVRLPKGVGIVAEARGGLGSIDARGLHKRGQRYVNDAYENNAKTVVRLNISGGIGQIVLIGD